MLTRRLYALCCAAALCSILVAARLHHPVQVCPGFLPPNNLRIPLTLEQVGGLNEAQFNAVLDRIEANYGPIIAAHGGTLKINRLWEDATVNASANRQGSTYVLNMYGGLARHQAMTQDGFALVACHEMGHHLGGYPKVGWLINIGWLGSSWASNEGESDYFANLKCMRRMFADPATAGFTRLPADNEVARQACATFQSEQDQAVCMRNATAGVSVTAVFQDLHHDAKPPQFDTPDSRVVKHTDNAHPATQCRLDTYLQGALCAKPVSEEMGDKSPEPGSCTRSQGYELGLRPLCWYKPPKSEPQRLTNIAAKAPQVREALLKSAAFQALENQSSWQGL